MKRMITFYNNEVDRFDQVHKGLNKVARESKLDDLSIPTRRKSAGQLT
jgi:hypothetical protein